MLDSLISNYWFYAVQNLPLFKSGGKSIEGCIMYHAKQCNAGMEVDQKIGFGSSQTPIRLDYPPLYDQSDYLDMRTALSEWHPIQSNPKPDFERSLPFWVGFILLIVPLNILLNSENRWVQITPQIIIFLGCLGLPVWFPETLAVPNDLSNSMLG